MEKFSIYKCLISYIQLGYFNVKVLNTVLILEDTPYLFTFVHVINMKTEESYMVI